jgi:hypothetical protein
MPGRLHAVESIPVIHKKGEPYEASLWYYVLFDL